MEPRDLVMVVMVMVQQHQETLERITVAAEAAVVDNPDLAKRVIVVVEEL